MIQQLEHGGTEIRVAPADVADTSQVARVFEDIRRSMPALKGLIHCAGVFDDRLLVDHRWDLFEKVCAAKVSGSWNLHELTKDLELDFFVMFSAAAALFGAAGLGNYVAANEFMDRLAHHRARHRLPALSINWGPWQATGMAHAVTSRRTSQWTAAGVEQLNPAAALRALDYLMVEGSVHAAVMKANWSKGT